MAWIRWRGKHRLATIQWHCHLENCPECAARKTDVHSLKTGTADPEVAQWWKEDVERRVEGKAPTNHSLSAQEAVKRYLTSASIRLRPGTVEQYRRNLGYLLDAWSNVPIERWNRPLFETFIAACQRSGYQSRERRAKAAGEGGELRQTPWAPRTVEIMVRACTAFINWARSANVMVPDFIAGFRGPTVYQREPSALTRAQRDALLAAARGHYLEPVIGLAALSGLRRKEFKSAQAKDIDWQTQTILVRGTKRGRDRRLPINATLEDILRRHRKVSGPIARRVANDSNAIRALKRLCVKAGVPRVTWHELRHTYLTILVREGADYSEAGKLAGHKPGSPVTGRYFHADTERMRELVDRTG